MKGKSTFSQSEVNSIILLIKQKLLADRERQKKLRNKIRAFGFYASDFGIGGGYDENDFLNAVEIVADNAPQNSSTIALLGEREKEVNRLPRKKGNSDEAYIIDLCDEILGVAAKRQHRFGFLLGDSGIQLPVDAYYDSLNWVVEYRERQHTEEVKFFNRRQTVSGVNRGEQRKIYDQRRRDVLPQNGVHLIEFGYDEFEHDRSKRLIRNKLKDIEIIRKKLKDNG